MKVVKKSIALITTILLTICLTPMVALGNEDAIIIQSLKVDSLEKPLGIDNPHPAFSWVLDSDGYDKGQSAYRVIVSKDKAEVEQKKGSSWDSKKQKGENNYDILYGGKDLESRTKYYWAVEVWDEKERSIGWSEISNFETGIIAQKEWKGEWIGQKSTGMNFDNSNWIWRRDGADFNGVPEGTQYFRKNFQINKDKTVNSVFVGVTADDEYKLFVNGTEVGENGGNDAWKNGKLFDITTHVTSDVENVIAASVYNTSRGYAGLLSKIEVSYSDGTKDVFVSDDSWKIGKTLEENWINKEFNDSLWVAPDQVVKYGESPWGKGVVPSEENAFAATVLRKEFQANKGVIKEARAYVSGLGFFEMQINGNLPDDTVLNPANTQYTQTVLYRVFDVTALLNEGKNAIGVELGNNFYNETCSVWGWQNAAWRDEPKLRMELVITYENGETQSLVTDETWKVTREGPITTNSIYYGETYDARKELTGFAKIDYSDANWGNAQKMDAPAGDLKAQTMEPIRRTKEMRVSNITKLENGSYVLTVPEMLAGWIKLSIKNSIAGDKVTITYGEKLKADGQVEKLGGPDGVNSGWWPKAYNQQDNYICKGESGTETFEPKFSYKGYQYIQIDGYKENLAAEDVVCYRTSNDMGVTGAFETSNPLLNNMHQIMMTTMDNNMQGKPTDTPVWEKNGWLGDANVALETMLYNYGFENMLTQFIETMEDCQKDFGNVPNMVPTQGWGNDNSVVWNSIFVFGVDEMVNSYGKESYVKEQYDAMRILALKDIEESKKHGWTWSDGQLADWVSPMGQGAENSNLPYSESPSEGSGIAGTAYTYHVLDVMAQLADSLGKEGDAAEYRGAMEQIYVAFNAKFYNKEKQIYETKTWNQAGKRGTYRQTSQLLPLAYGLVPEEYKEGVLLNLVNDIMDKDYHLDTGCVGSKFILPILSENGYGDVAYKIATQTTYPSWGYMAERGTSLWEMWEDNSRSLGHYFLGTYDEWFYKGIGGIKDMKKGYQTFTIEPVIGGDLTYANTSVDTVRGMVKNHWAIEGEEVKLSIEVPVGSHAKVVLSANEIEQIKLGGNVITTELPGVRSIEMKSGKAEIVIGSGSYDFSAPKKVEAVNKVTLKIAIKQGQALTQIDYKQEAWKNYQEVLAEAIVVSEDASVDQTRVDTMRDTLIRAMDELNLQIDENRKELKEVVAKVEKVNPIAHFDADIVQFEAAYELAKNGCINPELEGEALVALKDDLLVTIAQLETRKFENYALNKPVTASTSHEDGHWGWGKNLVTDGNRKNESSNGEYTGYSSSVGEAKANDHKEWMFINLEEIKEINSVVIYPATQKPKEENNCYGFPKTFDILVSEDGEEWTTVISVEDQPVPSYGPIHFTFDGIKAQYIKLDAKNLNPKVTDHNYYYMQLSEIEVYNSKQEVTDISLGEFIMPTTIKFGSKIVEAETTDAVINHRLTMVGTWKGYDDSEEIDLSKVPEVGTYTGKLTFIAPPTHVFPIGLASTFAANEPVITVEDEGRKLVYTYKVVIEKQEAPALSDQNLYMKEGVEAETSVDIKALIEEYLPAIGYTLGTVEDPQSIFMQESIEISEAGMLKVKVNNTGITGNQGIIPIVVQLKNYEDLLLYIHVTLTDKEPVTIKSGVKNAVYSGMPYADLKIPSGIVQSSSSEYTGGFTVIYNEDEQIVPQNAGEYSVKITPADPAYVGEWSGKFTILAKELKLTALPKSIMEGEAIPSLENPEKDKDYKVEGLVGTDDVSASIAMNYLDTKGQNVDVNNMKPGTYSIAISSTAISSNYTPQFVNGTLEVLAKKKEEKEEGESGKGEKNKNIDSSEATKKKAASTGDSNHTKLLGLLFIISIGGIIWVDYRRKRRIKR